MRAQNAQRNNANEVNIFSKLTIRKQSDSGKPHKKECFQVIVYQLLENNFNV
jgi:hypothetical protein